MDCVISASVQGSFNGLDFLLLFLILFACKSVIVPLTWNVRFYFGPLVICIPQLLGQRMPVAVLFYFGQLCLLYKHGLNQMEGFSCVNISFLGEI